MVMTIEIVCFRFACYTARERRVWVLLQSRYELFCGNCSAGLQCVKGPVIDILLDSPSKCKKIQGNILHINMFETLRWSNAV